MKEILKNSNTKVLVSNIYYSGFLKLGTIGISFLLVPLLVDYLSATDYGIWITILSIVNWFNMLDLGLGNGLKNKLTEYQTKNEFLLSKKYVSTTYVVMSMVCLSAAVVCGLGALTLPWFKIFNVSKQLDHNIGIAISITLFFTIVNIILRLVNNVLHANQKSFKVDLINFISQLSIFIILYIVKIRLEASLIIVALLFSLVQFVVLLAANLYYFIVNYKPIRPKLADYDKSIAKDVYKLGGNFFFLQIAGVIMFMTDNFVIVNLFGPNIVSEYNIAYKYFSVMPMGWSLILTPLWSLTTKAYFSGELNWIKGMMNKLTLFWLLTLVAGAIMYFMAPLVYHLWIDDKIKVSSQVSFFVLINSLVNVFSVIMATFINGIGKIKLQIYITILTAIINIPLAIFLSKYMGLGVIGVPLATSFCLAISSGLAFVQCRLILSNKSKGIWNE